MAAGNLVLVVVPDGTFRRSLEFALETEGFAVHSHATVRHAFSSGTARKAVCAVIDDAAVEDWLDAADQFGGFARPVVLLAGPFRTVPAMPGVSVIPKPFLGAPLVHAVRMAAENRA